MSLFTGVLFALLMAVASAQNDPVAQCRRFHHVNVERSGTGYTNGGCLLTCNIHGKYYTHPMYEGQSCPNGAYGQVCRNGRCSGSRRNGYIDVEVISASMSRFANAYAFVCLNNNSAPVTLPLKDRSQCVYCSTHVISSAYPVWNEICGGSGKNVFNDDARVTIEVFDSQPSGAVFLGGSTLTIQQLLRNNDNNREIHLAMVNGRVSGQINTRITFSPL